jgi:hypothetical protein
MRQAVITKENGKMANNTVKETFTLFTEIIYKDISLMEKPTQKKHYLFILMVLFIRVRLRIIDLKEVTVNSNISITEPNILVPGSMISLMEKENKLIKMEAHTKVNFKQVKNTEKVFSLGKTEKFMKVHLSMVIYKELAN